MKRIPLKTNSSTRVRLMIVLAVLIVGGALFWSPQPTRASLVPLYSFSGSDGANPYASVMQGSDGNLYGTTLFGGSGGAGTVFKITLGGRLTSLHSFNYSDGATPVGGLVQGSDGDFYGTTYSGGGASDAGTVFKITSGGSLTVLYSFSNSDGRNPHAGLVLGTDGDFYGTTIAGGANNGGTVFKITSGGSFTMLHSFSGSHFVFLNGSHPVAGLVQGSDGNFYGTTQDGGASDAGTVFKITPGGSLTSLHSFSYTDGFLPYGVLVQGSDGDFYGTTVAGGASNAGTVFRITSGGILTTLHNFSSSDGARPYCGLVQGSDGNFYGTTFAGSQGGTVFKITSGGSFATLYSFIGGPYAGLAQASDGNFYGTFSNGGGGVFKITLDDCPNDPDKTEPGVCGCGVPDADSDHDGTLDCIDACPNDPNKIAAGACGCGVPDSDSDSDGTPDCHDQCPNDPNKIATGVCGCGVPETDSDRDGVPDCIDNCAFTANPNQANWDHDGVGDACDPPADENQCKNKGWMNFIYPQTFKNQGDCIQFVNTAK